MVGSKAAKAVFGGLKYVSGLTALLAFAHLHAELGGDEDLVPAAVQRTPQVFFTLPAAIDIGRIEKVDPGFNRLVHYGSCATCINAPSKIVASQTRKGNVQRTDLSFFHCALFHCILRGYSNPAGRPNFPLKTNSLTGLRWRGATSFARRSSGSDPESPG